MSRSTEPRGARAVRRGPIRTIGVLTVAISAAVTGSPHGLGAQEEARRPAVPTVDVPIHDPVLTEADGTYYVFGTGRGIDVWRSDDRERWVRIGPVFQESPAWVREILPDFRNQIWAPDIIEQHGTYYLYYSASSFGRNNSAIGVATNRALDPASPEYEWVDHGMVVQSVPGRDMWNAIDPHLVFDETGTPWMSFGSHWGGIKLVRMDPSLTRIDDSQEWHSIAARHRYWKLDERDAGDSANPEPDYDTLYPRRILELNRASESGAIEAPVIFHKNGWYYLFVSWDRCCRGAESTYKVVVGRSREIQGPYLDREDERMEWGGGTLVTQGFAESDRWAAGGHSDAVTIDGTDYLVFHAYDRTDEGRSKLLVREIRWDRYGWPTVDVNAP